MNIRTELKIAARAQITITLDRMENERRFHPPSMLGIVEKIESSVDGARDVAWSTLIGAARQAGRDKGIYDRSNDEYDWNKK